jgi:hypothetical protein
LRYSATFYRVTELFTSVISADKNYVTMQLTK